MDRRARCRRRRCHCRRGRTVLRRETSPPQIRKGGREDCPNRGVHAREAHRPLTSLPHHIRITPSDHTIVRAAGVPPGISAIGAAAVGVFGRAVWAFVTAAEPGAVCRAACVHGASAATSAGGVRGVASVSDGIASGRAARRSAPGWCSVWWPVSSWTLAVAR